MKVYKGTDKNMVCHGKQYVLGETATEEKAKLCEYGLHACEMPIDVLNYYPPTTSRYFEAEADDVADAVAYLVTAKYVTGEVLRVDGGIAM